MQSLIDSIVAAREVSTPLLGITTPDQPAVVMALSERVNGGTPIISWDRARGFLALNDPGSKALGHLCEATGLKPEEIPVATADPSDAMRHAAALPKSTVLVAQSMDRFLHETPSGLLVQSILNLRDQFKSNQRTLIMLSPDFDWPPELRHDVIMLDDPLPDEEGYAAIMRDVYKAADLKEPNKQVIEKATLAVRGLSSFEADQVLAMSYAMSPKRDGVDLNAAWELKKSAIAKVKGLTMTLDGPDVKDLRGLDQALAMFDDLWAGPKSPLVLVRIDEIDKSFAGLGSGGGPGDNTGVTQDLHQQFLTTMEDYGWIGAILVGIRGSGKTVLTQSVGAAHGAPTIAMDTGAMKAKHVGESEAAHREAFRTIRSIGGSRVCVLATCNRLDVLPPELLRRFKLGIYYFDLLTAEERDALWPIYLKRYGHPLDSKRPPDEGWTGAEIRNCCEMAWMLRKSVFEFGSTQIVPVTKSDPKSIDTLRTQAENRFLSASYPGTYHRPQAAPHVSDQARHISRKEA